VNTHCIRAKVARARRGLRDSSGNSIVEAAIITPLMLLLTFAIIDFSSLFYAYMALENGVSQAARFAITGNVNNGQTREQSIRAAMRDATPTLTLADSAFAFSHMPPGGTVWESGTGDPGDISRVTVTYPWELMTPLVNVFFPSGRLVINVESAMLNEPRFE
jgi:Flp pilus assembly protein TadG